MECKIKLSRLLLEGCSEFLARKLRRSLCVVCLDFLAKKLRRKSKRRVKKNLCSLRKLCVEKVASQQPDEVYRKRIRWTKKEVTTK